MSGRRLPSAGERGATWQVRCLEADDLAMIAMIDRSEQWMSSTPWSTVLSPSDQSMVEIPPWDPTGTGPYSVAAQIQFCRPLMDSGAGLAVVDPTFEPGLAWLSWLHLRRAHRRRGVAQALWKAATDVARLCEARSIYVSATPTGSAVGIYLSQRCRLANPAHPVLIAKEPDDIHLLCPLA